MKLLQYLKEEKRPTRTKNISEEEFTEAVNSKCKPALDAVPIYRGNPATKFDFGFISPGKYERRSANTDNWYTLLINNSSTWKEYPKRALICTFDKDTAVGFGTGNVYRAYPVGNANIGVCPAGDFWGSFRKINASGAVVRGLDQFSSILSDIFREAMDNKPVRDESWDHMKYYAKAVPDWFNRPKTTDFGREGRARNYLIDKKYDGGDFIKFIEGLLDPEDNDMKHFNVSEIPTYYANKFKEVWLDTDCYMSKIQ